MPTNTNLRTIRLACDGSPSQATIAKRLGLDRSWLAGLEQAQNLPADTTATAIRLRDLAACYDLDPPELLDALDESQRNELEARYDLITHTLSRFTDLMHPGPKTHTLAQLRTLKGYTQQEVATHLGVDRSVLAHLEGGQLTGDDQTIMHRLETLARLYEVDLHQIFRALTDDQREELAERAQAAEALRDHLHSLGCGS